MYIGKVILGWTEREVWFMSPYKILALFKIHREFNRERFPEVSEPTTTTASGTVGDIDRAMDALGV